MLIAATAPEGHRGVTVAAAGSGHPGPHRGGGLRNREAAWSTAAQARSSSSCPPTLPDEFFFMEMNTRLQVEHPVTELVTGVDLVEWQLRIAAGQALTLTQEQVVLNGHADRGTGLRRGSGSRLPADRRHGAARDRALAGVRVDSALADGMTITSDYDPMMAKVIAWAPTRAKPCTAARGPAGDRHPRAAHQPRVPRAAARRARRHRPGIWTPD